MQTNRGSMTCDQCVYYEREWHQCRRHAPYKNDKHNHPKWPATWDNNWCGDFEPMPQDLDLEIKDELC